MKKFFALLLALVLTMSLAACGGGDKPAADGSALKTVEEGKLHMATNAAFPPYEMLTDDGSFEGIDVEVAAEIAKKLGLELVVDDQDFTAAITAAGNGQSDIVMAGLTVNEERKATLDFTESYATGVQVVIVREDSPAVQSIDDLDSAVMIGTQKGTTGYIYASDTPENGGYGED
ncbi:MAG: ABC transporter substrate-binding protein, partial [Oscillospiraceae bacterium]|nr:ABC transporter substrate-binding protein [Oscillospiraceae bacterium]